MHLYTYQFGTRYPQKFAKKVHNTWGEEGDQNVVQYDHIIYVHHICIQNFIQHPQSNRFNPHVHARAREVLDQNPYHRGCNG